MVRSEPARPVAPSPVADESSADQGPDQLTLSREGLSLSRRSGSEQTSPGASADTTQPAAAASQDGEENNQAPGNPVNKLSQAEQQMVRQLRQRDQQVKQHELTHLAAAGQYARGGPSYSYQQGPDGRQYAVGGEVGIDIGKENAPEKTIAKMRVVQRAALAPAQPSSTDRAIAAAAASIEQSAQRQLQQEATEAAATATVTPAANENEHARPSSLDFFA